MIVGLGRRVFPIHLGRTQPTGLDCENEPAGSPGGRCGGELGGVKDAHADVVRYRTRCSSILVSKQIVLEFIIRG